MDVGRQGKGVLKEKFMTNSNQFNIARYEL